MTLFAVFKCRVIGQQEFGLFRGSLIFNEENWFDEEFGEFLGLYIDCGIRFESLFVKKKVFADLKSGNSSFKVKFSEKLLIIVPFFNCWWSKTLKKSSMNRFFYKNGLKFHISLNFSHNSNFLQLKNDYKKQTKDA